MKINLRVLFPEDAIGKLRATGEFSDEDLDQVAMELDAHSDKFTRFLEATQHTSGSWFNPIVSFTAKERNSANFYQLECRKTLSENKRDIKWNDDHLESLEPIETSADVQITLPHRIAVSNTASLKSNTVAGVGENMQEFVVHPAVAETFFAAELSGFSLRPVFHSKTQEKQSDIAQLYSDSIMPNVELDRTTPLDPDVGLRQLGCFTYRDLDDKILCDFNRTAESWSGESNPLWIVSSNVRNTFLQHKLRGWAFRPVLETGSALQLEYQRLWSDLFERAANNPNNTF